jgi:hypothetical protein
MAINLAALLQGVEEPLIPPAPPGYPPNTRPLSMDMPPQAVAPQETVATPEQESEVKALYPIQHKGLFGVKGTLRDVLGLLGDSYLMVNGRNPYYAPIRRGEKYGDILAGKYINNAEENFINNPLLAIQRLVEEGFGQEAASLYQNHVKNEAAKQQAALNEARLSRQEARDAQLALQGEASRGKNLQETIARTYSGITDQNTLDQFNAMLASRLKGTTLEGHPLPRTVQEAQRYGIQPYQQQRLEDYDVGLGIQQQNANTNQATSRPRSDTPVELFERYSAIPADKRTPEQQAFITKYTSTGKRSGRRTGGGGSPSAPPRKKGDAYRTSDGRIWRSPDGKTWQ